MDFLEEFKSICNANSLLGIGFIGCGNMGSAILQGILDSKLMEPQSIIVSAKTEKSIARLQKLNVNTTKSNREVFERSRIVFLCTKPNTLDAVAADLKGIDDKKLVGKQLVSVLAGELFISISFNSLPTNLIICRNRNPHNQKKSQHVRSLHHSHNAQHATSSVSRCNCNLCL